MNWQTLKRHLVLDYHPALVAERLLPFVLRRRLHIALVLLTVLSAFAAPWNRHLLGVFFLFFAGWLVSACFRALHYFYADEQYELAKILYDSSFTDPIRNFLESKTGAYIFARIGADAAALKNFLQHRPAIIPARDLSFVNGAHTSLLDYFKELVRTDTHLAQFVASFGVSLTDMEAVLGWVVTEQEHTLATQRWWSRENLGRIPSIGKTWNYGRLNKLEEFSRPVPPVPASFYAEKELLALERILQRGHQANAFLVGESTEEKLEIISALAQRIEEGSVMPELEYKRVIILDTDALIGTVHSMSDFENLLRQLGNEAASAGNSILTFLDFPAFVAVGKKWGLEITEALDPFLITEGVQIIALAGRKAYDNLLAEQPSLAERFGSVLLESTSRSGTLKAVQKEMEILETHIPVFFTYQALQAVVEGGERYLTGGFQPEKSLALLHEVAAQRSSRAHGRTLVDRQDVEDVLKIKTGISIGNVSEGERSQLLSLEKILHQRIIGQDEAVNAIAGAVRRARTGLNNPNRPLGSFLFLGPTGVGKTETTKALADVFFGHGALVQEVGVEGEATIERLDMSEYAAGDALEKLIGAAGGEPGILADMIREHPYGVLLLDEFEKTTPEVLNLFLQILDEGFFSDGEGEKVSCRNLLIIATSNAGAEMIWDAVKRGNDLSHARELILDQLVHTGQFRPELLNRFDGVIVFHPLAREHLERIARLQLEKLAKRLSGRGYTLVVSDELVQFVLRAGTDPKFGARPMNRAITNTVEQAVADKIIAAKLQPGANIVLTTKELSRAQV